ncbi:MAG: diversity-generating retroelement protein Avd [Saprospiraceae bacterium]
MILPYIASLSNLLHAAQKAAAGKRGKASVAQFFVHLEPEILRLHRELVERSWCPGGYRTFKIYDPKERIISAAPFADRVVHHVMSDTILLKSYDLLKSAVPMINRLPRNQKFTFGDRLQNHLSDLLEALIEALFSPPAEKRPILQAVNLRLEKIRFLFRLGHDLGLYDTATWMAFAQRVDEIGRMTGGWLKSLK